jgi:hypothetical protein
MGGIGLGLERFVKECERLIVSALLGANDSKKMLRLGVAGLCASIRSAEVGIALLEADS